MYLDKPQEYKNYLMPPVDYELRAKRVALYTGYVLKDVFERLDTETLDGTKQSLFTAFFGEYNQDKWTCVRGKIESVILWEKYL